MRPETYSELIVLDKGELNEISAGKDTLCGALAGAAIVSGFAGALPATLFFGGAFMAICWSGH